jgi:hypothetical protein
MRILRVLFLASLLVPASLSQAQAAFNDCRVQGPQGGEPNYGYPFGLGDFVSYDTAIGSQNFTLEPVISLNLDWGKQIINLTPGNTSSKKLTRGDYRKGFQVIDSHEIELGLGISASTEFVNSTGLAEVIPYAGLMPLAGRKMVAVRHASTRSQADAFGQMRRVPTTAEAFNKLKNGDSVTYMSSGGIVFWAGLSYYYAGLSLAAAAQGDFQVTLRKVGSDKMFVEVKDAKIRSFGIQKGVVIAGTETSAYYDNSTATSFVINYKNQTGLSMLRNAIAGNLAPAQAMAARKSDVVKFAGEEKRSGDGTYHLSSVGVPYIFDFTATDAEYSDMSWKRSNLCGQKSNTQYGVYHETESNSVTDEVSDRDSQMFYGASYYNTDRSGRKIAEGYFGHLEISHENDVSTGESLNDAMKDLASRTGLHKQVILSLANSDDDLEYTSYKLRMHFSKANTSNLLARAKMSRSALNNLADKIVSAYTLGRDTDDLCGVILGEEGREPTQACYEALLSQTQRGLAKMVENLNDMRSAKNAREATIAYSRFGEAMMTNRFTFKIGTMFAGKGLRMQYLLQGSTISRYKLNFVTTNDTGNFVRAN